MGLMKYIAIHNACGIRIGEVENLSRQMPELYCEVCGRSRPKLVSDAADVTFRRKPAAEQDARTRAKRRREASKNG